VARAARRLLFLVAPSSLPSDVAAEAALPLVVVLLAVLPLLMPFDESLLVLSFFIASSAA
jgi:hypothetical protein